MPTSPGPISPGTRRVRRWTGTCAQLKRAQRGPRRTRAGSHPDQGQSDRGQPLGPTSTGRISPRRERFYADTRFARRGNAPSRQTGSTVGPVPYPSVPATDRRTGKAPNPLGESVGSALGPARGRVVPSSLGGRRRSVGLVERVARPGLEPGHHDSVVGGILPTAPLVEECGAAGSPLRVRGPRSRPASRRRGDPRRACLRAGARTRPVSRGVATRPTIASLRSRGASRSRASRWLLVAA